MKKSILKCLSILVLTGSIFTITSCGEVPDTNGSEPATSETTSADSSSVATTSNIKSINALTEKISLKTDDSVSIKDYYEVIGINDNKITAGTESKCVYSVSDDKVIKLSGSTGMKGVSAGSATVTITSKVDSTKSVTIPVEVTDAYFDYTKSLASSCNLTQEHPDDGGVITETGETNTYLYVKGIESTKLYAECTFSIQSVASSEKYPKVGIFVSTEKNTEKPRNQVFFFLDAWIGDNGNSSWNNYGVCEVENETNWAWNPGITNATARHKDNGHTGTSVSYNKEFKLGLLRDGMNLHCYVGGEYRFSMQILDSLFKTADDKIAASTIGFFDFNSNVTYSQYSATADEATINNKLSAISTYKYVGETGFEWAAD